MSDKTLDIYGGEEIEVTSSTPNPIQSGASQGGDAEGRNEDAGESGGSEQGGSEEGGNEHGGEEGGMKESGDKKDETEQEQESDSQESEKQKEEEALPICVILKNGKYKGFFGEIKEVNETGTATITEITSFNTLYLIKEEYAIVDDVVDYRYVNKQLQYYEVLYGSLYSIPAKEDILLGISVVSIINNSEGTFHTVNSTDIICLHKEGEVPELQQEKTLCNVYNFIMELKNNGAWSFEEYILGSAVFKPYDNMSALIYLDMDGLYYFKNNAIAEYGNSLVELDEKLLKAFILALKNNPIYFKEDGYKYFFYDKIGLFLKSLINENKICFIGNKGVIAPISDNKVFVTFGEKYTQLNIVIGDDYIDFIKKDIEFGFYASRYIHLCTTDEAYKQTIRYGDIDSQKVQLLLLKPFIGFVNLLK
jgi:hypothetical protein